MEGRSGVVSDIHCRENRKYEKFDPIPIVAAQKMRIRTHQQCKCLAMAKLIVAPFLKPFEDRVEPLVGVLLEMPEYRNVACVTYFL